MRQIRGGEKMLVKKGYSNLSKVRYNGGQEQKNLFLQVNKIFFPLSSSIFVKQHECASGAHLLACSAP
jgi:hypothetical protein